MGLTVHEALDTTSIVLASYLSALTPITNMGASLEGAEMMTCGRAGRGSKGGGGWGAAHSWARDAAARGDKGVQCAAPADACLAL